MRQLFLNRFRPAAQAAQKPLPSLGMCLLMDFLGVAFLAIPFIGPFLEMLFAPVSAFIYLRMFGVRRGLFGGVFNFIEELIPGLDVIPTFTITWAIQFINRKKSNLSIIQPVGR